MNEHKTPDDYEYNNFCDNKCSCDKNKRETLTFREILIFILLIIGLLLLCLTGAE